MPIDVIMPALSPTMEKGTLARWLVSEGDRVSPGDILAEIETDKATMEVEAVDEGTVAKIVVPGGTQDVRINAVIAVLAGEGELDVVKPEARNDRVLGVATAEVRDEKESSSPRLEGDSADRSGVPRSAELAQAAAVHTQRGGSSRLFASPLARRLAKNAGLNLSGINGSGPHGRIVGADLEAALAGDPNLALAAPLAKKAPAATPAPKPISDEQVLKVFEQGSYELVPHDNMRKTIARRLVEAKSTIPHFYLTLDCELDALLALRSQLNAAAPVRKADQSETPAYKLSVNDMVIKAMALALRDVPAANVSWTDKAMVHHKHVDVAVAVSIPGGLITPIVRKADEKTLSAISNEMKDLATRARSGKLKPEEYQGGTTAVSNLGMFGIRDFSAIINPPHATILAVGAGEERALARKGEIKIANVMSVTLSTDHRAVDGAVGAEFLAAFKRYIENPMGMLV
jgi:pyruvate dehydrogenase E2 component (dihydrolipoamide acetyltransferase)